MDILITGSIAYDYLMRFPGRFKEALIAGSIEKISVSFLVDDMTRHFGGIAPNIAYTMALLGERPRILGTAGRDFGPYRDWLESAGVDTSTVVVLDHLFTASFFANTDLENNQIASFYAGAMGEAGQYGIRDVTEHLPDWVVISPNAPDAMRNLIDECVAHDIPFVYDPSQQTARIDGDELIHGIRNCAMLTCNEYEWEMIESKTGLTLPKALKMGFILVITKGKEGAHIYENGEAHFIPTFNNVQIIDPTGVGDAFRAGLLVGMANDWPWEISGRMGSLAASFVLEQNGTQNHRFTPQAFVERFRTQFDDQGLLDALAATTDAKLSQ
jgi:adenosine kinase